MLSIAGWLLGLVAVGVVATSAFLLIFGLFRVAIGQPPARPPNVLFCVGGALLGLVLFALSVWIGFLGQRGG